MDKDYFEQAFRRVSIADQEFVRAIVQAAGVDWYDHVGRRMPAETITRLRNAISRELELQRTGH